MQSPTTRALLRYGRFQMLLRTCWVYRMRRCTGFRPSRTSGSARAMLPLIASSMKDDFISSSMATGRRWAIKSDMVGFLAHYVGAQCSNIRASGHANDAFFDRAELPDLRGDAGDQRARM